MYRTGALEWATLVGEGFGSIIISATSYAPQSFFPVVSCATVPYPGTSSVPSTDDVGVVVDGAGAYVRVHDLQMNDVRCGIRQGRSGAEVGG